MDFRPGSILTAERAALASELLPDGMIAAEADAKVSFLNERAVQVLGIARDDLVGRDIRSALVLRDSDGTDWWEVTDPWRGLNIRTGHREKYLMVEGGAQVLVTAKYVRPARNQPVNRVILMLRDAEARRRVEADHAALISTVAHELRSPLTSVKGFSSTLLRRWDRFTDDQKRLMLETIEADADRVTRLITELLDVSRIDAGRLQIRPLPIDVAAVFDRHVERAVASGQERDRFTIDVPDHLPEVWADPDRLDQILSNLIENAFRHGEGVVTLAAESSARAARKELASKGHHAPGVDLIVADRGKGIPPEHRDLVFTRFWHGSGRGSTGLGLYVVKGLVEAHGGHVRVEAAPSGGARFRLSLPSEPPDYLA
jgi:signal transduction histidine kinase